MTRIANAAERIGCSELVLDTFNALKKHFKQIVITKEREKKGDHDKNNGKANRHGDDAMSLSKGTAATLQTGALSPLEHQYSIAYATALRPSRAPKRPEDWPLWRVADSDLKLNPTLESKSGGAKNRKRSSKRRHAANKKEGTAT